MKRSTTGAALWLLVVFLSGIAVGAVGYRLYTVKKVSASVVPPPVKKLSPEEFRKSYLDELHNKLQLDETQVHKIGSVLDDTRARFDAEKDRSKAAMKEIHDSQVASIRSILTDTQKAEYDKIHAEREKRRKERQEMERRKNSGF